MNMPDVLSGDQHTITLEYLVAKLTKAPNAAHRNDLFHVCISFAFSAAHVLVVQQYTGTSRPLLVPCTSGTYDCRVRYFYYKNIAVRYLYGATFTTRYGTTTTPPLLW